MTLAIARLEGETVMLDCVREVRPPFSPDPVVADFVTLFASYCCFCLDALQIALCFSGLSL